MTKRLNPSTPQLCAVAIAAALAAFSAPSFAQPSRTAGMPGYAVDAAGRPVRSGFGQCVRTQFWTPALAAEPCDRVARASVATPPPVAQAPQVQPAPEPKPEPVAQPEPPRPVIQKLTLSTDVLFDFGSAELKPGGKARLDQLVSEIKGANVDEIIATGHADRIASEEYNQKLSEARAEAVKNYLAGQGANAQRVTAEGKGESSPVTGSDCAKMGPEKASNKKLVACLQPDRRVEIEVLGSRQVAAGQTPAAAGSTSGAAGSTSK